MSLAVRVAQTAPRRADPAHNRDVVEEVAARSADDGVDLLVFPELALTGYDVGRRAVELALHPSELPGVALPEDGPVVMFGAVTRGAGGLIHNACVTARGSRVLDVRHKVYLPTYGTFDEGRIFAPGRHGPRPVEVAGWRICPLVCEELWHPSLPWLAGQAGADALVVLAAAAGREPPPAEAPERGFGSAGAWELLARSAALVHGCWVVLANRAGVEGSLTFAGGSLVVEPGGRIATRGTAEGVDELDHPLTREAVDRARTAYPHLRDEDPALLARELDRMLRASGPSEAPGSAGTPGPSDETDRPPPEKGS